MLLFKYGAHSSSLRDAVTALCNKLCNSEVEWKELEALMSCRLVPLDKAPGVRPLGIGDPLRRLVGKALLELVGEEAKRVCGSDQLCAGMKAGTEGAFHAVSRMLKKVKGSGGVLLVDADNGFNRLNRARELHTARKMWPSAYRCLHNVYQGEAKLHVGDGVLLSREGATQGDPLAMALYAVATLPLIRSLKDVEGAQQVWYADDAAAGGIFASLRSWMERLMVEGPAFGYFVNPEKTVLVVDPDDIDEAKHLLGHLGVKIKTAGKYLGGIIGVKKGVEEMTEEKAGNWVAKMERLAELAVDSPQEAFTVLTKSLLPSLNYFMRVSECSESCVAGFEEVTHKKVLPAIVGSDVSSTERAIMSLPAREGGMGITDVSREPNGAFKWSCTGTTHLSAALSGTSVFCPKEHDEQMQRAKVEYIAAKRDRDAKVLSEAIQQLSASRQRAVQRAIDGRTSHWLTACPTSAHQFDLSSVEFRDAIALRYRMPVANLPAVCDGCQQKCDIDHLLSCKVGGLVVRRHNEVRDTLGDLCAKALGRQVIREPEIVRSDGEREGLVADLAVRGVFQPQTEALFDICVIDTDAQSHLNKTPAEVLAAAATMKHRKYDEEVKKRRGRFVPFAISVDGMMHKEAEEIIKAISRRLSVRWSRRYSECVCWVRTRLSFALIRATNQSIRGSRQKWRSLGLDDGAAIPYMMS
eukprot:GHVN01004364.1.p1 GENE.GHVN01004364.1~~GHVN01004364.1.p1  ORF type:complete len:695 (+),score=78.46 GHVN01004364.1:2-2086(+)